jgi:biopolymer transport protein ExbB
MVELFVRGGLTMWPIALLSVIALAVFLERLWGLRSGGVAPALLQRRVAEAIHKGQIEEALAACRRDRSPLAAVLAAGLRMHGRDRATVLEAMEDAGRREVIGMERFIGVVGTVASVEPLLGLLGTVSGMMKGFDIVRLQGLATPSALAGAVGEALVATWASLIVAIPAFLAYRFLLWRVDGAALRLEAAAETFAELLRTPPRANAPMAEGE